MNSKGKENSGFTLVELLVSISISALVLLSVTLIMDYSTRNYRNASAEVSLQTEAQIILNQMMDLIIEANNVKYDPSGELTIYYEDQIIMILLDGSKHQLDFVRYNLTGAQIGSKELVGRYVDGFSVIDTGVDNSNSQIKISLNLKNGSHAYEIKDQIITLRNQIKPVTEP